MALFLVGTPIGNLKDITQRALEVLRSVNVILVESYKDSIKLLNFYGIKPRQIIKYNDRNKRRATPQILEILKKEDVALITSAGMPGVSDPAADLVEQCYPLGVPVIPVPGPSALTAAIAASGFRAQDFLFVGFLPKKRGQITKIFNEAKASEHALIFFESPYRLVKTLEIIKEVAPHAEIFVGKEMTKKFEAYIRGSADNILKKAREDKNFLKGEFTCAVKFD